MENLKQIWKIKDRLCDIIVETFLFAILRSANNCSEITAFTQNYKATSKVL